MTTAADWERWLLDHFRSLRLDQQARLLVHLNIDGLAPPEDPEPAPTLVPDPPGPADVARAVYLARKAQGEHNWRVRRARKKGRNGTADVIELFPGRKRAEEPEPQP